MDCEEEITPPGVWFTTKAGLGVWRVQVRRTDRLYGKQFSVLKYGSVETARHAAIAWHREDHGQAVIYRGSIAHHPDRFDLDKHHAIETGKVFAVCGNTWRMLHDSRHATHFDFIGNFERHFGLFEGCGSAIPFDTVAQDSASGACC